MGATWIHRLDKLNLLATIELLDDLQGELNIATGGDPVSIPMWNPVIKYLELHPGDTSGIRDAYIERRFKIASFLKERHVINEFSVVEGGHRWRNRIVIEADPDTVRHTLKQCEAEYQHRFPSLEPAEATKAMAKRQPFTRGQWIAIIGLGIGVVGVIAAWLAVPGFQEWAKHLLGLPVH